MMSRSTGSRILSMSILESSCILFRCLFLCFHLLSSYLHCHLLLSCYLEIQILIPSYYLELFLLLCQLSLLRLNVSFLAYNLICLLFLAFHRTVILDDRWSCFDSCKCCCMTTKESFCNWTFSCLNNRVIVVHRWVWRVWSWCWISCRIWRRVSCWIWRRIPCWISCCLRHNYSGLCLDHLVRRCSCRVI